jgi:glutathione S-transferase
MADLVLTTFDWVPEWPRGFVRDLRIRWALEEAQLPYRVATTPFENRPAAQLDHQPFNQVPWLTDGDLSIFESGAILLHLAAKSPALMPPGAKGRAETTEWVFAALNSVEMAVLPWMLLHFTGGAAEGPAFKALDDFVTLRLDRLEPVLAARDWLAGGRFTVADILMSDVLRLLARFDRLAAHPAAAAYVTRATTRPAFQTAHAAQLALYTAADVARAGA